PRAGAGRGFALAPPGAGFPIAEAGFGGAPSELSRCWPLVPRCPVGFGALAARPASRVQRRGAVRSPSREPVLFRCLFPRSLPANVQRRARPAGEADSLPLPSYAWKNSTDSFLPGSVPLARAGVGL